MRITHGMVTDTSLRNVQRNLERMEELQNQLTSGSRLRRPSDDPIGVARALTFQEGLDQADQYLRNIDQATAWLNVTDTALDALGNVLQRARELTVRGANDTLSVDDRLAVKTEIEQLQQQALNVSNSKYETRYIFSGTRSSDAAYNSVGGAFQGDHAPIEREISQGVVMAVNVDGETVFKPVFDALAAVHAAMGQPSGNDASAAVDQIDAALNAVMIARAQVGAKANRLELSKNRVQDVQVSLTSLLSDVKDVDVAEAITNFSLQETVYKASLAAAAKALQPSLIDYLR